MNDQCCGSCPGGCVIQARKIEMGNDRDMLAAAPVPPAGGEVEVLAWIIQYQSSIPGFTGQRLVQIENPDPCSGETTELVDRAHVTRLQAEVEIERKTRESAEGGWREANRVIAMQRAKLDEQQSELTKSRDLLTDMLKDDDMPAHWFAKRITEILDGQSAPAAKLCPECNQPHCLGVCVEKGDAEESYSSRMGGCDE